MEKFKKIGQQSIYQGKRLHLVNEQLEKPDGKMVEWELIKHRGAAAVVPVDDQGKLVLVQQYRSASDSITLELPAGVLDSPEELPIICAKRELEEETGYQAGQFHYLFYLYTSIGICDEIIHLYVAEELKVTQQNLDEDEIIECLHLDLEECLAMVFDGRIVDAKTIAGIMAYEHWRRQRLTD